MSCYENLQGRYTLPSAEYTRIRRDYISKLNTIIEKNYTQAQSAYAAVKALKGRPTQEMIAAAVNSSGLSSLGLLRLITKINVNDYRLVDYVQTQSWNDTSYKFSIIKASKSDFHAPKRADFAMLKIASKNFRSNDVPDYHFNADSDSYVIFDDATKTIYVGVEEGNRSVDRAMESLSPASLIIGLLKGVSWGSLKKNGGFCEYRSEFDDEDRDIGQIRMPNIRYALGGAGDEVLDRIRAPRRPSTNKPSVTISRPITIVNMGR